MDAATALEVPTATAQRWLRRLASDGHIQLLAGGVSGYVSLEAELSSSTVTLASLIDLARASVSELAIAPKGRQAEHVARDVEAITPGQLADLERLVRVIAANWPGANGDAARVPAEAFAWDPQAAGGRGAWSLQDDLEHWVRQDHRRKYEARKAKRGEKAAEWDERLAAPSVADYRGALNNLLYLASTKGLITRTPRNASSAGAPLLYHPAWAPVVEKFATWVVSREVGRKDRGRAHARATISLGYRVLAVYATRLGGTSLRTTDWVAVRAAIEVDRTAGVIPETQYAAARRAWRATTAHLGTRMKVPETLHWAIQRDDRYTLVSHAAIEAAAEATVSMAERDFSEWRADDGQYQTELVDGYFGLRTFTAWSTVSDTQLRYHTPPLPPRVWGAAHENGVARRRNPRPEQVCRNTLFFRLNIVARIAGWARREQGFDGSVDGLEKLVQPAWVAAYMEWLMETAGGGNRDGRAAAFACASTLAQISIGFLHGRAVQRVYIAEEAVRAASTPEDVATARAGLEAAVTMRDGMVTTCHELERLAADMKPAHKDVDQVAAKIAIIAEAWRGTDNIDGLFKVDRLIDLLIGQIVDVGGSSLAEQYAAIQSGTFEPSLRWAHAVRTATLLVVSIHVPLRVETLTQLTCDMWKTHSVGGMTLTPAPWEGAIQLDIPAPVMKAKRPFRPRLIKPQHVRAGGQLGSEPHERGIRRDLLRLWFCPGGGRDVIIRWPVRGHPPVDPKNVPWVFPGRPRKAKPTRNAEITNGKSPLVQSKQSRKAPTPRQWTPGRVSAAFRAEVKKFAPELKLDYDRLRAIQGATGGHVLRKLYGCYWAVRNLLYCSRMLHHKNVEITASHYCALDEGAIDLNLESEIERHPTVRAALDSSSINAAGADLDQARNRIASLEQRNRELEAALNRRAA